MSARDADHYFLAGYRSRRTHGHEGANAESVCPYQGALVRGRGGWQRQQWLRGWLIADRDHPYDAFPVEVNSGEMP